jgi:hypothetical protein
VAAAANADLQVLLSGEADGGDDVGAAHAAGDRDGTAVDHGVPHRTTFVVARIAGGEQVTVETVTEGDGGGDGCHGCQIPSNRYSA